MSGVNLAELGSLMSLPTDKTVLGVGVDDLDGIDTT